MQTYAVVLTGGKQYIAEEGKDVVVDYLPGELKQKLSFDKVLMYVKDEEVVALGKPYIEKAHVDAEIIEQGRAEKIRVARFKAKSRYRKVTGFRQLLTKVRIMQISV